ncbi:MAG: response regulator [Bryobacteraceae bacterium]
MAVDAAPVILLVDDDAMVRTFASTMLQTHGFGIIEAENGSHGVARFSENRQVVDLVLSDIVMPKMSGAEMVRQILTLDPDVRVVFMTGYSGESLPEDYQKSFVVLQKPFTPDALVRTVRASLARRS